MNNLTDARLAEPVRVAAAVIESDGLVRIFQRGGNDSYTGKWEFPGGKADTGEALEVALRREIWEELAVDCVVGKALDHYQYQYPNRAPIWLTFFAVDLIGEPKLLEHTADAWVKQEDLYCYGNLMNADMEFVATRYVLPRQLDTARERIVELERWKPIETAPRDKTMVALLHKTGDYARYGVGWYMPMNGWQGWSANVTPTHWAPLPAIDTARAAQGKE